MSDASPSSGDRLAPAAMTGPRWSFLSNHGQVLVCIADDPHSRMRDIASALDITERAAQRLVADLVSSGYVARAREGRRNTYAVRTDLPVKLPVRRDLALGDLLDLLSPVQAA